MSIEKQKELLFIPIVNLVSCIFFLKMISEKNITSFYVFKLLFKVFLVVIVITILEIAIGDVFSQIWIKNLVSLISSYLSSLFIAYTAIKEQEKYLE